MATNSLSESSFRLSRVFEQYQQYNSRSTGLLVSQLAQKLQIDLYVECTALRRAQQQKIGNLPQTLGWQIKRRLTQNVGNEAVATSVFKKGKRKGQFKSKSIASQIRRAASGQKHVTVEQEIQLRKRFAAFFQASGWLNSTIRRLTKPFRMLPEAVKIEQLSGPDYRVSITNPRPNSAEFAESTGYAARALEHRVEEMQTYIDRKIRGDSFEFNRRQPNFSGKNIESEVERAMQGAFSRAA